MTAQTPEVIHEGKVRISYRGEDTRVVVATDRISVFDVVLDQPVPGKGIVLTHMTEHWLYNTPVGRVMPHHMITSKVGYPEWIAPVDRNRTMVVRQLNMLPVEAIVRGYLTGSGWKSYKKDHKVCGIKLPAGLVEMVQFDQPLFTPSTKAEEGHDQNISFEEMVVLLDGNRPLAEKVRDMSIALYQAGAAYALERGIILVDTKFEFGIDEASGQLMLGDEVLTPDSSRYVAVETYVEGEPPKSMDKQRVRDYYEREHPEWDKTAPAPPMPEELIAQTREVYGDIAKRLTGVNPIA